MSDRSLHLRAWWLPAILWLAVMTALWLVAAWAITLIRSFQFHRAAPILILLALGTLAGWLAYVIWSWRASRTRSIRWPRWTWRFAGLLVAIGLSFGAAEISYYTEPGEVELQALAIGLWLVAIGLAVFAMWSRNDRRAVEVDQPIGRGELSGVLAILLLAIALRAIDLEHTPTLILGDETKYGVAAQYLRENLIIKPFVTGSDGHWNFYLHLIGLSISTFGTTLTALRMPSVIAGVFSILTTWLVARQLWGPRPALIAAALLTTYHHHIHYSRIGFNSVDDPFFSTLIFACVWLAWRTGRRRVWVLTALATGLSQYFFVGGRLVLIQLGLLAAFWLITNRARVRQQALNIALAIGVFLCIVMPIIHFWVISPDDYMSSINTKNIIASGWLDNQRQLGYTDVQSLSRQAEDVFTALVIDSDESFYWQQPMLTPIMAGLVFIGLLYFIGRLRSGPHWWVVSSLTLLLLFGGILTVTPTTGSHRLMGTGPLFMILIAVLIDRAWAWVEQRVPPYSLSRHSVLAAAGSLAVIALMFMDARTYFVDYLDGHQRYSPEVPLNIAHRYLIDVQARTADQPLQIACVGLNQDICRGTTLQFFVPQLIARADIVTDLPNLDAVPNKEGRMQVVLINALLTNEVRHASERYAPAPPHILFDLLGQPLFVAYERP